MLLGRPETEVLEILTIICNTMEMQHIKKCSTNSNSNSNLNPMIYREHDCSINYLLPGPNREADRRTSAK